MRTNETISVRRTFRTYISIYPLLGLCQWIEAAIRATWSHSFRGKAIKGLDLGIVAPCEPMPPRIFTFRSKPPRTEQMYCKRLERKTP